MISSLGKRPFASLEAEPQRQYTYSRFDNLDVVFHIFSQKCSDSKELSDQDLLAFEGACHMHRTLTTSVWYQLRRKNFFNIDWVVCGTDHKKNYFLSKSVVTYIQHLPIKGRNTRKTIIKKFSTICNQFPIFQSFIDLTLLSTENLNIPKELAKQLKQEKILDTIQEVYHFALLATFRKGEKDQPKKVLNSQYELMEKKVESLINLNATFINRCVIKIFERYFLINKYEDFIIKLVRQADAKGDYSGYQELRRLRINLQTSDFQEIEQELNADSNPLILAQEFINLQPRARLRVEKNKKDLYLYWIDICDQDPMPQEDRCIESQKLFLKLKEHYDKEIMPPDLLMAVVQFQLKVQNWEEADKYLSQILNEHNNSNPHLIWLSAKLKVKLNQNEKANDYYNQLIGKKQSKFYNKIFFESLKVKILLEKFQEADKELKNFFSTIRDFVELTSRPYFSNGVHGFICDYSSSMDPIQDCINLKYHVKDEKGAKWFETLVLLAKLNEYNNWQACQEANQHFTEDFYRAEYQIPHKLLKKLAQIKMKLQEDKAAEFLYDLYFSSKKTKKNDQDSGFFGDHSEYISYAALKYQAEKWEEAEKLYTQIFYDRHNDFCNYSSDALEKFAHTKLNLEKWEEAEHLYSILLQDMEGANPLAVYLNYAHVCLQLNKYERALEMYQCAQSFSPQHVDARVDADIAYTLMNLERFREANDFYNKAILLYGDQQPPEHVLEEAAIVRSKLGL